MSGTRKTFVDMKQCLRFAKKEKRMVSAVLDDFTDGGVFICVCE